MCASVAGARGCEGSAARRGAQTEAARGPLAQLSAVRLPWPPRTKRWETFIAIQWSNFVPLKHNNTYFLCLCFFFSFS